MKRILICATMLDTIKAFLIPHIECLQSLGYVVDIAGNKTTGELDGLVHAVYDIPFQRSPFSAANLGAARKLGKILSENAYDIVHFHTPTASAYGRLIARRARRSGTRVFYTAHGFHFYKGAPLINWLIFYPVERRLAHDTDVLVTINQEDYDRAKRCLKAKQVVYMRGVGVDTHKAESVQTDRAAKRGELGIPAGDFVLLSVGELIPRKNHQVVLKALEGIDKNAVTYVICGRGEQEAHLKDLAGALTPDGKVMLLGFRADVLDIYKAADLFVFPSHQEGLPVALMEAMASGLPCLVSRIRGNVDLIGDSSALFAPDDVSELREKLLTLMRDEGLRGRLGRRNLEAVRPFDLDAIRADLQKLYGAP